MLKKVLLLLALCMALAASALAAVSEKTVQGDNYRLSYPVFSFENARAAKKINREMSRKAAAVQKLLCSPIYKEVGTSYKIISETDEWVCLTFTSWNYTGGAHGMYCTEGLVYDKNSGSPLPCSHFIQPPEAEELRQGIAGKTLPVYCSDLKTPSSAPFLEYIKNFRVSSDYIVAEDGSVYLMYQPYELDSYAAGVTYVKIR